MKMNVLLRKSGWRVTISALVASFLLILGGCGKQSSSVPQTQGPAPVAAEPAKPEASARFEIISSRAEMSLGQLALILEFPRPLVGTQSFDDLISVKDGQGASVSGSWALNEDGKTLRFPFVQANASYNVQVKGELAAIDGETLGSETSKDIFTGPLEPAVGFAAQGSVLPARETRGLPVVSVNVNEVDVEFLRVHDNELANFFAAYQKNGKRGSWELDPEYGWYEREGKPVAEITESVYSNRFVLTGKENERSLS